MSEWFGQVIQPESVSELSEALREAELWVESDLPSFLGEPDSPSRAILDTHLGRPFAVVEETHLPARELRVLCDRSAMNQVIEVSPENQIVTVQSGCRLGDLNRTLADYGLCVPVVEPHGAGYDALSIGVLAEWDLPNMLLAQHGSWRDWVTGMQLVQSDGQIVKAGSKVVKNVTGYDLHKLMIGSRGTLAVGTEITLRVTPLKSLAVFEGEITGNQPVTHAFYRVPRSDWDVMTEEIRRDSLSWMFDAAGCQIALAANHNLFPEFAGAFTWNWMEGRTSRLSPGEVKLARRTMELFDPSGKMNPGEMKAQ
jgi:FAD/FMN-containing dehydrogenase